MFVMIGLKGQPGMGSLVLGAVRGSRQSLLKEHSVEDRRRAGVGVEYQHSEPCDDRKCHVNVMIFGGEQG